MIDQTTPQWINDKGEGVQFGGGKPQEDDRAQFQRLEFIAELGWQAHIAWERIIGEIPKPDWRNLSSDQRSVLLQGVQWLIENPTSSISVQHDAWCASKAGNGWEYGEKKDLSRKIHPNMTCFDDLPFSQQMKARLWRHIIFAVLS